MFPDAKPSKWSVWVLQDSRACSQLISNKDRLICVQFTGRIITLYNTCSQSLAVLSRLSPEPDTLERTCSLLPLMVGNTLTLVCRDKYLKLQCYIQTGTNFPRRRKSTFHSSLWPKVWIYSTHSYVGSESGPQFIFKSFKAFIGSVEHFHTLQETAKLCKKACFKEGKGCVAPGKEKAWNSLKCRNCSLLTLLCPWGPPLILPWGQMLIRYKRAALVTWVQLCWFTPAPSQHLSTFPKVVCGLINTWSAYQRQDMCINMKNYLS